MNFSFLKKIPNDHPMAVSCSPLEVNVLNLSGAKVCLLKYGKTNSKY